MYANLKKDKYMADHSKIVDLRVRPVPIDDYKVYEDAIKNHKNDIAELEKQRKPLMDLRQTLKWGTPERKENEKQFDKISASISQHDSKIRFLEEKNKLMIDWKPQRKIIYEINFDGYYPQKIIDLLPEGHMGKQLAWIINTRANMMKELNKKSNKNIRTVYMDLVLKDSADKIYVKCSWDIHRVTGHDEYYEYSRTYEYHVDEYKLNNVSDMPVQFQSEETIKKIREKKEQEEAKAQKADTTIRKGEKNGHEVEYKGFDIDNGKYTNLYEMTGKQVDDETIYTERKRDKFGGYDMVNTKTWQDDRLIGKYDVKAVIRINRINEVEKKFYYNIVGYVTQDAYSDSSPKHFFEYADTKERVARTSVKNGVLNLPVDNLPSGYDIPAFEVSKAEEIKHADGGDGKHHFLVDGMFKATANNDKKASLKTATYDDLVDFEVYKHLLNDHDRPFVTGFTEKDYEVISKPVERLTANQSGEYKGKTKMEDTVRPTFIAVWTNKDKGQARMIGYYVKSYTEDHPTKKNAVPCNQFQVQFPYKRTTKKYVDFNKIKVDDVNMSALKNTF
jgi:hypothetical protein